jgi:hypothetical protein
MNGRPIAGLQVQLVTADGVGVASGTTVGDGRAVLLTGDGTPPVAGTFKAVFADAGGAEENPMEPSKKSAASRVPALYLRAATTTAQNTLDGSGRSQVVDLRSR